MVHMCLNDELIHKFNKMKLKNGVSYSEIARRLLEDVDLKKLKFKTVGELCSEAYKKRIKKLSK